MALGSTAATYLLGVKSPLSGLRGRIHPALGAKLIVTYHPAYLLRDPRQKKEAWADLQDRDAGAEGYPGVTFDCKSTDFLEILSPVSVLWCAIYPVNDRNKRLKR